MIKTSYLQEVFTPRRLALAFQKIAALSDQAEPARLESNSPELCQGMRPVSPEEAGRNGLMVFILLAYCHKDYCWKRSPKARLNSLSISA